MYKGLVPLLIYRTVSIKEFSKICTHFQSDPTHFQRSIIIQPQFRTIWSYNLIVQSHLIESFSPCYRRIINFIGYPGE